MTTTEDARRDAYALDVEVEQLGHDDPAVREALVHLGAGGGGMAGRHRDVWLADDQEHATRVIVDSRFVA